MYGAWPCDSDGHSDGKDVSGKLASNQGQKDWEERLKERKKELRQISHQILRLQERGVHLATEAEEKKIQTENLQEEIRELSCPTWEEESCDMEISGLKLALTVLTEEESIRHVGDRSERKEKERECLE